MHAENIVGNVLLDIIVRADITLRAKNVQPANIVLVVLQYAKHVQPV
jgi:hypothetical protein